MGSDKLISWDYEDYKWKELNSKLFSVSVFGFERLRINV